MRFRAWFAGALCAAFAAGAADLACSTFSASDDTTPGDDASAAGDSAVEAGGADTGVEVPFVPVDGGACDLAKPFSLPERVKDVSTLDDEWGAWPFDGKMYFGRMKSSLFSVLEGQSSDGVWKEKTVTLTGIADSRNPSLSPDGLTMLFQANSYSVGRAERADKKEAFNYVGLLPAPSGLFQSPAKFGGGYVWIAATSGAGPSNLRRATFYPDAAIGPSEPVSGVNEPGSSTSYGVANVDASRIYFTSNRPGGAGSFDIYTAARVGETYANVTLVPELSTPVDEYPAWLSDDGCQMLVMRRAGDAATSQHDIYVTTKPK